MKCKSQWCVLKSLLSYELACCGLYNQSQLQQFHLQFNYREKHHCLTYVLSYTYYKNVRNFWIQWWPRLSSESWTALLAKDRPLHWVLLHFDWQRIVFACDELWTFWWRPNEERHWKQADFFSVFCTNCWNVFFSYYVNDQSFIWSYQYHHCNIRMHRVLEMKRSGVGRTHPQFFDMLLSIKNEVENLRSVLLSHRGFAE